MGNNLQRTSEEITQLYNDYVDMVYRICFMLLKNPADAEDAVQAVFIKVIEKNVVFESKEHEKAWFIVAAKNHCKNQLKHWWQKTISFEYERHEGAQEDERSELLDLVLQLPEKFKLPIYLYYYEGYNSDEIAKILDLNPSTLRSRLKKGRELLREKVGGGLLE